MQMGLTVTDKAAAALADVVEEMGLAPDKVLRLEPDGSGGLNLETSVEAEGDQVVQHDGKTVLAIPQAVSDALGNTILNYRAPPEGDGFALEDGEEQRRGRHHQRW